MLVICNRIFSTVPLPNQCMHCGHVILHKPIKIYSSLDIYCTDYSAIPEDMCTIIDDKGILQYYWCIPAYYCKQCGKHHVKCS